MRKNTLDKLFGSRIRVKLLKFLFRNYPTETLATETRLKYGSILANARGSSPGGSFGAHELSKRIQEPLEQTKKELTFLVGLGLITKKK